MSLSTVLLTDRPGERSIYCFVTVVSYISADGLQPMSWQRDTVLDLAPPHVSTINAVDAYRAIKLYHDRLWTFAKSIAADFRDSVQNAQGQDLEDWMMVSLNTGEDSFPIVLTRPPSSGDHDWLSFQSLMTPITWPCSAQLQQSGLQTTFAGTVLVTIVFGGAGREAAAREVPAGATLGPDGPAQVTLPRALHVPSGDDAMFFMRYEEDKEEANALNQVWFPDQPLCLRKPVRRSQRLAEKASRQASRQVG
jgi:hypothetical protein